MGEVFLAEDTELKRLVAVKILHAEVAEDKERISRFIQEARAASALNHPNILTIHEIGNFEDSRFIVSEYVKGKTLREKLKQEKSNPRGKSGTRFTNRRCPRSRPRSRNRSPRH